MFFCNIITTWGRKDFQKFGGWEVKFYFFHKNHFCETCGEWNEGKLCIFTAHETHIWHFLALGRERKNKDWLLNLTLNEFQRKAIFFKPMRNDDSALYSLILFIGFGHCTTKMGQRRWVMAAQVDTTKYSVSIYRPNTSTDQPRHLSC